MSKNKKITLIISIALVSIILLIGVTYALNYTQTSTNQELVLGNIYMHYNEISGLSITDAVPGSDYSNYFEFTISGKNTYTKKDIYYDFILNRGDIPTGKTEDNRIPDKYLKFKLVSVDSSNQETEIFADKTYASLENKRIHVETIEKNTTSEVNKKYRLYMTIDNSLLIGNTSDAVFTFSEWEDAFASIKLNVTGDFEEKELNPSNPYNDCFETSVKEDGTLEITNYYTYYEYLYEDNRDMYKDNELYQNQLCTTDVVIPSEIDGVTVTSIGDGSFILKNLTSVKFPDTIITIGDSAFIGNSLENITFPNSLTTIGDSAFDDNNLEIVTLPSSLTTLGVGVFTSNSESGMTINIGSSIEYIGDGSITDMSNAYDIVNINKTCAEIEQIPISAENLTSAYPWSPYHSESYIINGTDGECYQGTGIFPGGWGE